VSPLTSEARGYIAPRRIGTELGEEDILHRREAVVRGHRRSACCERCLVHEGGLLRERWYRDNDGDLEGTVEAGLTPTFAAARLVALRSWSTSRVSVGGPETPEVPH
jgi:hypothetical protein